jgi:hypothetical protein
MMTLNEVASSPKVLATHRYRSSVGYVWQPTAGEVEHNTESSDRRYARGRALGLGWARDTVGPKGILSEAELHVPRAWLNAGIPSMANRGEPVGPVGLVWGEDAGQIRLYPGGAVTGVIAAVFTRFAACGSVLTTWSWLREEKLKWPLQPAAGATSPVLQVMWVEPMYCAVHTVLTHPARGGALGFGSTRGESYVAGDGDLRAGGFGSGATDGRCSSGTTTRDICTGVVSWPTSSGSAAIFARWRSCPAPGPCGRAALCCPGPAGCGARGRELCFYCDVRPPAATGSGELIDGTLRHLRIGGGAIIDAALAGSAMAGDVETAWLAAARRFRDGLGGVVDRHGRGVPPGRVDGTRAERRDPAIDAGNRPVARGLETVGEGIALAGPVRAALRAARQPETLTPEQQTSILGWGTDLGVSRSAPSSTDLDRNELLGTLLAVVCLDRPAGADFVFRGKVGARRDPRVPLTTPNRVRTDQDTIDRVRRLAVRCPDPPIGGIVNHQNRSTARELPFGVGRVPGLRHLGNMDCQQPGCHPAVAEPPVTTVGWVQDLVGSTVTAGSLTQAVVLRLRRLPGGGRYGHFRSRRPRGSDQSAGVRPRSRRGVGGEAGDRSTSAGSTRAGQGGGGAEVGVPDRQASRRGWVGR